MKKVKCFKLGSNYYTAIGYLQNDAEYKTTQNGTALATFSIVIGKDDEQPQGKQRVYLNCQAWRSDAEFARALKKGDKVKVEGEINKHEYNGKTYTSLVCDFISVQGRTPVESPNSMPESSPAPAGIDTSDFEEVSDDDSGLPF